MEPDDLVLDLLEEADDLDAAPAIEVVAWVSSLTLVAATCSAVALWWGVLYGG